MKYRKIKGSENLILVELIPNIKMLEVNYKRILINRVFNDDKLNKDKMIILIQKLSKEILRKVVYGEHLDLYVVNIFDNMFYRNKFLLSELLDNDLLKQYFVFMSNFNTYNSRKNFFNTNNFKYACLQDCLHINDVVNKFNIIDAEGILTIEGEGIVNSATQANDYSMAVWAKNGGKAIVCMQEYVMDSLLLNTI